MRAIWNGYPDYKLVLVVETASDLEVVTRFCEDMIRHNLQFSIGNALSMPRDHNGNPHGYIQFEGRPQTESTPH